MAIDTIIKKEATNSIRTRDIGKIILPFRLLKMIKSSFIAILVENDPKASREIGGFRPVSGEG